MTLRPIEGPCSEVHPGQPHVDRAAPPSAPDPCLTCNNGLDLHCPKCRACPKAPWGWDCDHRDAFAAAMQVENHNRRIERERAAPDPEGLPSVTAPQLVHAWMEHVRVAEEASNQRLGITDARHRCAPVCADAILARLSPVEPDR